MNNKERSFLQSLSSVFSAQLAALGGMVSRNGGRPLIDQLLRVVPIVGGSINRSWVKCVVVFSRRLYSLRKEGGRAFLIIYLKTCSTLLMQSVGGQRIADTGPFGARVSRTKAGIPRIIPGVMRSRIRNGEERVIRVWLTLFGLYRVLEAPYKLKLSTITEPGVPLSGDLLSEFSRFLTDHFT